MSGGIIKALKNLLGIGLEKTVADEILAFHAEKAAEAMLDPDQSRVNAELGRRLATASLRERRVMALAAPYRESYLDELTTALWDGRPAAYLFTTALSPQGTSDMTALLNRDYQVRDGGDAEWVCEGLLKEFGAAKTPRSAVVHLAQAAHVATAAVGVGYLPLGSALTLGERITTLAASTCTSWGDYSGCFLVSERRTNTDGTGRKWQRQFLSDKVGDLLINPLSPWKVLNWPGTDG